MVFLYGVVVGSPKIKAQATEGTPSLQEPPSVEAITMEPSSSHVSLQKTAEDAYVFLVLLFG